MNDVPRLAVVGMGGYAAEHHRAVQALETKRLLQLCCTCDPDRTAFQKAQVQFQFAERGVTSYHDFDEMLTSEAPQLDILVVATPIALHEPMHAAGVERGLAVYLEKPPTLDPRALTRMIARDDTAPQRAVVGFNFILQPERRRLKQRLLAGEFGALRAVSLLAVWPRSSAYFERAAWAGRLLDGAGNLVLDSCLGNATAHMTHNLLFWAGGPEIDSWGVVDRVEAQLYRAHRIEGADTFFVRAALRGGVELRVAVTHTGSSPSRQRETVECERARIVYDVYGDVHIHWQDGRIENVPRQAYDPLEANYLDYLAYLAGTKSRPHTSLADSLPFVHLNALAYVSSQRIHRFRNHDVERVQSGQGGGEEHFVSVPDLPSSLEAFANGAEFPDFELAERRARRAVGPKHLADLDACIAAMTQERGDAPGSRV